MRFTRWIARVAPVALVALACGAVAPGVARPPMPRPC